MEYQERNSKRAEQIALGLGWFSIGLGLAELLAPRTVARLVGMPEASSAVLRAFGAREVGNGLALLAQPDRAAWLWSRVGGDAVDLSYLASGLTDEDAQPARIVAAMSAVLGVTAIDALTAQQLRGSEGALRRAGAIRVEQVTTINKPIHEVYQFWRRFENLPRFMRHLESVETLDARRSRWRAKGPAGLTVEWEADMLEDREDEWIAWRSLPGSQVENSGSVRFTAAPGARGTELRVQLQYTPPGGRVGRNIAWMFGEEPEQQIYDDLRRFKQLMETGEIPLSDGPGLWRPAQPARDPQEVRSLAGVQR